MFRLEDVKPTDEVQLNPFKQAPFSHPFIYIYGFIVKYSNFQGFSKTCKSHTMPYSSQSHNVWQHSMLKFFPSLFQCTAQKSKNSSSACSGDTEYFCIIVTVSGFWMNWSINLDEANMLKMCLSHKSFLSLLPSSFHTLQSISCILWEDEALPGHHFLSTVRYKAMNKTAWITVNNTSDKTNATWKCSQQETRVTVTKQDSNKYGSQSFATLPRVVDNPLHPQPQHLPQHRHTYTALSNTPNLLGLAAGGNWDVTNQPGPWQSTSCPAIMSSRWRRLSWGGNDAVEKR